MRVHPTPPISHDTEHSIKEAERGASALTVVVIGALAVFLGGVAGGGLAAWGRLIGDEAVALEVAFHGARLGAALALIGLGVQSIVRRKWLALMGGAMSFAMTVAVLAWLRGW